MFVMVCLSNYTSSHNHGSVKNGCISNRIVTFKRYSAIFLFHDYGRKIIMGISGYPPNATFPQENKAFLRDY